MGERRTNFEWRDAKPNKKVFANGPRRVANYGRCVLEVFEDCSVNGRLNPCPTGEFSYVIKERNVFAIGPHGGGREGPAPNMHQSASTAQTAAERRAMRDPKVRRRCKRKR